MIGCGGTTNGWISKGVVRGTGLRDEGREGKEGKDSEANGLE